MPVCKLNLKIAERHGAKILKFKDLPKQAQLALVVYMDCWFLNSDVQPGKPIDSYLPFCLKHHGDELFGIAMVPMEHLKKEIMKRKGDVKREFKTFDAYHKWYCTSSRGMQVYSKKSVWPCILSQMGEEIFEDGWHRFHSYVKLGLTEVPVLFFPPRKRGKK